MARRTEGTLICKLNDGAVVQQTESIRLGHIDWKMAIKLTEAEKLHVEVFCCAENEKSNLWGCGAEFVVEVENQQGDVSVERATDQFKCTNKSHVFEMAGTGAPVDLNTISEVRIHIKVNRTYGIRKFRLTDFSEPLEIDSEVILVVEDKKIYVDKYSLMFFSPVFRAMFSSSFKENKENKVEIKDVDYPTMVTFVQLLNHHRRVIRDETVIGLLVLSDRYDVPFVKPECEDFLCTTQYFSNAEKLQIAEQYTFSKLQAETLKVITKAEIKELVGAEEKDKDKMGQRTAQALLEKLCNIEKAESAAAGTSATQP